MCGFFPQENHSLEGFTFGHRSVTLEIVPFPGYVFSSSEAIQDCTFLK